MTGRPAGRDLPPCRSSRHGSTTPRIRCPRRTGAIRGFPRYTLTAVGHRIYARMGAPTPSGYMGMNRSGTLGSSYIIATRLVGPGQVPLAAEIQRPRPAQPSGGSQPLDQLRGDAGRRQSERVRGRDRPAGADGDLCRLFRRGDRAIAGGSATWGRPLPRSTTSWRWGSASGPRRGRLRPPPALARGPVPLLPDEPRCRDLARGGDRCRCDGSPTIRARTRPAEGRGATAT